MSERRTRRRPTSAQDAGYASRDRAHRPQMGDGAPAGERPAGKPLDQAARARMESRFGHDFGAVRVHDGSEAAAAAASLDASAYTVGDHLVFAAGRYAPETVGGAHLLAHELAHVVQQANGGERSHAVSDAHDPAEGEARQVADSVLAGGDVSVSAPAGAAIARAGEEDDSPLGAFSTISTLLGLPGKTGLTSLPFMTENAGGFMPSYADRLGFIPGITGTLGTVGALDKAVSGFAEGDYLKGASGSLGTAGGLGGLVSWLGKDTLGSTAGSLGGAAGLLGAGGSVLDAVGNFSEGNYGAGAYDSTKALGGTMSGLAALGGFKLSSVAGMGAGQALAGGGASGLAALGPAAAVLGAGLAGAGVGTMLSEHTTVGENSVDSLGWLDDLLTDEGEQSFLLQQTENIGENWDNGEYLDAIGNGLAIGGLGLAGAVGGLAGGAVDLATQVGGGISDAASWVGGGISDAAGSVGDFFEDLW